MKPVLSPALLGTYNIKNVQRADKDKRITFSRSGEGMGGNEGAPRHEMPKMRLIRAGTANVHNTQRKTMGKLTLFNIFQQNPSFNELLSWLSH